MLQRGKRAMFEMNVAYFLSGCGMVPISWRPSAVKPPEKRALAHHKAPRLCPLCWILGCGCPPQPRFLWTEDDDRDWVATRGWKPGINAKIGTD